MRWLRGYLAMSAAATVGMIVGQWLIAARTADEFQVPAPNLPGRGRPVVSPRQDSRPHRTATPSTSPRVINDRSRR